MIFLQDQIEALSCLTKLLPEVPGYWSQRLHHDLGHAFIQVMSIDRKPDSKSRDCKKN